MRERALHSRGDTCMDARTNILKPRWVTRYHLTMALLAVTIAAVAVTTIVGSTANAQKTSLSTQSVLARLSAPNDTENPDIVVDCVSPVLTVALSIDRSTSVYGNENQYRSTVKAFIDTLYNEIVSRGGRINLIVNAFASRSVNQNPTTGSGTDRTMQTTISNASTRDVLKSSIDRIFFTDNRGASGGNHYFAASNDAYDVARAYNPALQGPGSYGTTNWDDALLDIARIASSPTYNNVAPGHHIDLGLVLTDGNPNTHNGTNRIFAPSDVNTTVTTGSSSYPKDTVSALRSGAAVAGIPARPPMAVRGVLIASSAESFMREVFGTGSQNYSLASNFGSDLDAQLTEIVNSLTEGECGKTVVTPALTLTLNRTSISVVENGAPQPVQVTITNPSPVPVADIQVRVNGTVIRTLNLSPGASITFTYVVHLDIGDSLPSVLDFVAQGTATPLSNQKFADGASSKKVEASDTLGVAVKRLPLPA